MTDEDGPRRQFKIILIGESAVGKTSIMFRYCHDTFTEDRQPTVGVGFKPKLITMNEESIKLAIWDTAGQEKYRTIATTYYRNADGALLVYDISRPETLDKLTSVWIPELESNAGPGVRKLVVGNKSDLRGNADSQSFVSKEDGEAFAKKQQALFVETSAKTAENVANAFEELARRLLEKSKTQPPPPAPAAGVDLATQKTEESSVCC
jgi:Ras-related protein Rab-18